MDEEKKTKQKKKTTTTTTRKECIENERTRTTVQEKWHKMLTEKLLWHFSECGYVCVSLSQCNDIEL